MMRRRATSRLCGPGIIARLAFVLLALFAPAHAQSQNETVTYPSGGKQVTVEYFAPMTPGKYPGVILLHGSGGLEQATGDVFREIASTLASRGYVALIPHYFEKTDHPLGRPLQTGEYESWLAAVNDAIEYAARRPEVDPDRFAIIGYSMGSGLAMARATRDPRIKAIVSCSGAYPPVKPNKKLPPLLILHGSKDKSTTVDYVKKYAEALKEQEMPHDVHIYNGMGHNFDVPRFGDATKRAVAFFDKYVKQQPVRKR
jgi:carboxymethylenebutenolidase